MNPAALRSDLHRLKGSGSVILNTDAFPERNLDKAGYASAPREDGTLDGFKVYEVQMTEMTKTSEEHTSELQSLMRISYAVFCLKQKDTYTNNYAYPPLPISYP